MNFKIKTVEAGYAKVYNERGRFLGTLNETKDYSSTRTGTDWVALTASKKRTGGIEQTRAAAAEQLVRWHEALDARSRARKAQS